MPTLRERAARRLVAGARIVASPARLGVNDPLYGTANLLTKAGRDQLAEHYTAGLKTGASAAVARLNTSVAFLDKGQLWEDTSRQNDLSYYEVGKATFAGGYATQGRGYTHCIPRALVSIGEKQNFASLLTQLAVETVKRARDDAGVADEEGRKPWVGGSATFTGDKACLGRQLTAAALQAPDFFAIEGCSTAADVASVAEVLDEHSSREVVLKTTDSRGFEVPDPSPTTVGFELPVILLAAVPPCHDDFDDLARVAATVPHIVCVSAPTVVSQTDRDALRALLQGTALAGASETVGEMVVLE